MKAGTLHLVMTLSSTSPPPDPIPADTRVVLDHLAIVVHDFLCVGDVGMEDMHASVDRTFDVLRAHSVPSEQALASIKGIVRRVHSGGSLRALDDEAAHWLMSHLVTWMIASYYGRRSA